MNQNKGLSINHANLDKENMWKVIEWLLDGSVYLIVLEGDLSKVRTWTSGPLQDRIAKSVRMSCYQVLWVNVAGCSVREMQLQILQQLKVLPETTGYQEEESVASLRQKICTSLDHKCFLLILADIQTPHQFSLHNAFGYPTGSQFKMLCLTSQWVFPVSPSASYIRFLNLDYLSIDDEENPPQVSILPSQEVAMPTKKGWFQGLMQHKKKILEQDGMSFDKAWHLFLQNAGEAVYSPDIRPLAEAVVLQCLGSTSEICWAAGALRNPRGYTILILTAALEKARDPGLRLGLFNILDELCYKILPNKAIKDCFLYCTLYPENHEISMKELITSWIMEGFLEGFNCLEEAYEGGHHVLEQLIDHHLLDKWGSHHVKLPLFIRRGLTYLLPNNNYVTKDKSIRIFTRAGLRLTIPHLWNKESVRKICLMDENFQIMYPTIPEFLKSSILLLYGNGSQSPVEFPNAFFRKLQSLQVPALAQMGVGSLPSFLGSLPEVRVLVLKKFCSLEKLNHMHQFPNITVLSLSGASALKEIPDDFFLSMSYLQVLDLSGTRIEYLPSSLSQIFSLHNLILRGCSRLTLLPQLMYLTVLEVLDLSGATFLHEIHKNFGTKNSLHLLDFSRTLIHQLPTLYNLLCIRYLLLKGCPNLEVLPALDKLRNLEVLDLSGATNFRGFIDADFGPMDHLQKLNLSGTQVVWLPWISKCYVLQKLLLRGCLKIEALPDLTALKKLKVLDVSGATNLRRIKYKSLGEKGDLQKLDFSGVSVNRLPSLSKCANLRKLLLRGCPNLEILPDLEELTTLEVLDLSGSIAFKEFQHGSFGQKSNLRVLDLSGTQVVNLPILSKCRNLRQLLLSGCSKLETLPDLEAHTRLEVLDLSGINEFRGFQNETFGQMDDLRILNLSGTQVLQLPSVSKFTGLRQLLLRDCSKIESLPNLEALTKLEVLDLSGTQIVRVPLLFRSSGLRQLLLRGCSRLVELPPVEGIKTLEMFDICGVTALRDIPDDYFEGMDQLKVLNLSELLISQLPSSISNLRNLNQLILRGCSNIEMLPCLEALKGLEVLDLLGTRVNRFPIGFIKSAHLKRFYILNLMQKHGLDTKDVMQVLKDLKWL